MSAFDLYHANRPITGPMRIDALTGHEPSWRTDHGETPIYDSMIADYGPPGMSLGPATLVQADLDLGPRRARRALAEVTR